MPTKLAEASFTLKMIKEAGYKSTASALGELIDNSIQADANNIDIVVINKKQKVGARTSNNVFKLAVIDDGHGMDIETLSQCLSLGWGTRLDAEEGLGKFGFGLKGSSISQAGIVRVYSWQNSGEYFMVEVDSERFYSREIDEIADPIQVPALPDEIMYRFEQAKGNSGTLVVWEDLDIDIKLSETLSNRLNDELCRIYRHYLDDDDNYGTKRNICVKNYQDEDGEITSKPLKANDPLYLLTPNNLPDEKLQDIQTNVLNNEITLDISYKDKNGEIKSSPVLVTFSIAKPDIQNLNGNSKVGKHYENNCGISFVRAGREIEFGRFNLLDNSEPRHRWWGAEVRFEPVLDKIFQVTNNKQSIRGFKGIATGAAMDALLLEQQQGNLNAAMVLELNRTLSENIKNMMGVIKGRREGTLKEKKKKNPVVENANKIFAGSNKKTQSQENSQTKEEKFNTIVDDVMASDNSLSREDAEKIAETKLDLLIDINTKSWPGSLFLERKVLNNQSIGEINMSTNFHKKFWSYLEGQDDQKGFEALQYIMMALIRAEDELCYGHEERSKIFSQYRQRWGDYIQSLLEESD